MFDYFQKKGTMNYITVLKTGKKRKKSRSIKVIREVKYFFIKKQMFRMV